MTSLSNRSEEDKLIAKARTANKKHLIKIARMRNENAKEILNEMVDKQALIIVY